MKAVCVCSGGLDSTVAATIAKREGYEIYLFHVDYGQKAGEREKRAVNEIATVLSAKEVRFFRLSFFGRSSLTDPSVDIPTGDEVDLNGSETPSTWVPCRNLVLLSISSSYAESISAEAIFVGFNAEEALSYPDNTPEFVERFNKLLEKSVASFSTPPVVKAPLIHFFKDGIIKKGVEVGAPIELTWSCYFGKEKHCGICESCQHRKRGFERAGVEDPTKYEIP
ncbi:MAG: 7-cyano-7-deazaguanine synthase QueC [Candidatus Syntropharchaeia archaeon]